MALKKCKECGNKVSTKATACPECGAPIKKKKSGCLGSLLLILFIMVGIVYLFPSKDITPKQKNALPSR